MNTQRTLPSATVRLALVTALFLLIPLIAMQFSEEVVWTLSDFIFAGGLIFGTGFCYILVSRKAQDMVYRFAVGFALFTGLLLIWVNGAVGIIGSENNAFNLIYFAVIGVGILGALLARLKSAGMMFTLIAMAATQAVIAVIALFTGMAKVPESSIVEIIGVNAFFIFLFMISALLFRNADFRNADRREEINGLEKQA